MGGGAYYREGYYLRGELNRGFTVVKYISVYKENDTSQLFTEVKVASGEVFTAPRSSVDNLRSQLTRVWRRLLKGTGGESVNSTGCPEIE